MFDENADDTKKLEEREYCRRNRKRRPIDAIAPHLHSGATVKSIMLDVVFALMPAVAGSLVIFGRIVVPQCLIAVAAAVACDFICRKAYRGAGSRFDGSPLVTGLLVALSLPASAPLWFPALASAFAIVVAKELCGGIGRNFLNPAAAGIALLAVVFARQMAGNSWPILGFPGEEQIDAIASATPLTLLKQGTSPDSLHLLNSFLGVTGGKIGETSALLLLTGAAYLLARRVITWRIPVAMIAAIALMALLFGGSQGFLSAGYSVVISHILGGATILGAFLWRQTIRPRLPRRWRSIFLPLAAAF